MSARVPVCVRACVRACVRVCACVCVCEYVFAFVVLIIVFCFCRVSFSVAMYGPLGFFFLPVMTQNMCGVLSSNDGKTCAVLSGND